MGKTAERTNPELWNEVKDEVKRGSKGGEAGEWSARKAQLAVQEYKKRGGGYSGKKPSDNSLKRWTEEEWATKSGQPSGETGERYLPKGAREALTDEEYRATTEKKREDSSKGKQFSPQPRDIAAKTRRFRHAAVAATLRERTKADMLREAKQLEINGRSRMDKDELSQAIRYAKH
jgi:Family of unknown function (DUF5872)